MHKSNPIPFVKRITAIFQWGNSDRQSCYLVSKSWFFLTHANFVRAVRSFRGRYGVDAMSLTLLFSRSGTSEKILEKSWNNSVFVDHPEMSSEWESIGKTFSAGYSNKNLDDQAFLTERIESIKFCLQEIQKFQIKYSEFLIRQEQVDFIETLQNSFNSEILISQLYRQAFSDVRMREASFRRIDAIYEWYLFAHEKVITFIEGKRILKDYIYKLKNDFSVFSDEKVFNLKLYEKSSYSFNNEQKLKLEKIYEMIDGLKLFYRSLEDTCPENNDIINWLKSLPETSDHWLDSSPEAKASVERGLLQAKSGKVHRRSFIGMEFSD